MLLQGLTMTDLTRQMITKKKKKGCVINYFHMVGTVPLNDQSFLYDDTVS